MENIILGLNLLLEPFNFMMVLAGSVAGIIIGAIPGLTGPMAMAMLIPLTYGMESVPAFIVLVAIYCGSVFGGAISAILINTPGDGGAAATTFDGYPMSQRGLAGKALGTSMMCSSMGGMFSVVALILLAPQLADVALEFGPAEYFALGVLGLSMVASLGTKSQLRALIAVVLGLLIAVVGLDQITGSERYTFGVAYFLDGVPFMPLIIGLFGISEVLSRVGGIQSEKEVKVKASAVLPSFIELFRIRWTIAKSALIGTFVGILPGAGATTAAFMGYAEAARASKHPEKFGTGIMEGVAAPETANNAATGGAMVPLLALGIPGSGAAAILVGAFLLHGLTPGPMLFIQQQPLVYGIFAAMFVANILIVVTGFACIRLFVKALQIPYSIFGPVVIALAFSGVYSARNSLMDAWVMLGAGFLGYAMKKFKIPLAPLILGVVLGPIMESSFRRAWLISDGQLYGVITPPIAMSLLMLATLIMLSPMLRVLISKFQASRS